jgi:integrase
MSGKHTLGVKNLDLRRDVYHAALYVPPQLRDAMGGKRVLRENLHTSDLQTAIRLSGPILAQFRRKLEQAARSAAEALPPRTAEWLNKQADLHRAKVAELTRQLAQARDTVEWIDGQLGAAPGNAVTFLEAAAACIQAKSGAWKRDQWTPTLEKHVFPHIGGMPVGDVDTDAILAFLDPLWRAYPEMGSKIRLRLEAVLDFAKTRGWRTGDNPARWSGHLEHVLADRKLLAPVEHHTALDWRGIPELVAKLREENKVSTLAFEFLILNACRTAEVIGATWPEIDLAGKVWTIPAARMKARMEHRIPLCDRSLAILREMLANRQRRHGDVVFPGMRGKLSIDTFFKQLKRMQVDATPHGMRSSFKDWATETGADNELSEWCLAHVTGSGAERAYRRSDALDRRRVLMAQWCGFCGTEQL